VDETYVRIKGQDRFLYRAVDSAGQTIDFLLTAKLDTVAAKRFFRKTLLDPANPQPRVIKVDENRAYPAAVEERQAEGTLRRCRLRQCKYLNNIKQYSRARPSSSEKTSVTGHRVSIVLDGVAHLGGNRSRSHDSKGASQVGGQR
jgi:transposase-like protein